MSTAFIEAPYRPVDKATGKVLDDSPVYMTADVEDEYVVAQANEPLDENGHFVNEEVSTSVTATEFMEVPRDKVDYMDVSPKMVVSVATAMIPFLENDDANRALDGRQHAAPGSAAAQDRVAHCRYRYGVQGGA